MTRYLLKIAYFFTKLTQIDISEMYRNFFTRSADQFGGKISFIIHDIITQLQKVGAEKNEGIFRLSGSKQKIQELCLELNDGRVTDWSKYPDNNVLCDTLKKYFRDNSERNPLIPFFIYDPLIMIPPLYQADADVGLTKIKGLMKELSRPTYISLAFLIKYLNFVANNKESNKMDALNLARMFGPNIMCSPMAHENPLMANHEAQNNITQILIERADDIFDDFYLTPDDILTDEEIEKISHVQVNEGDIVDSMNLRELRFKSLIPYVPGYLINDPNFVRPL
ncbi:RhoGAP domain containing protein [Tritrichomonas foetus]|uniref:RhoGAP domain containing protein n=1 Tax=Tritrichomonas foetus TaxID=1144522 RepID=A0A1J4JED2_9EUKA|nr:RhoGAP domain containing protein [Tritrichomonas foetus]|eukprot:OHS95797.1 RhoGAP domain containing protein [Tritrichomonas foetus]